MKWLRWVFVCHFGSRCANVEVEKMVGPMPPPRDMVVHLSYECAGCGRTYVKEVAAEDVFLGPR